MRKLIGFLLILIGLAIGLLHVLAEEIITIEQIKYFHAQTIYWLIPALVVIGILCLIRIFILPSKKSGGEGGD